MAEAPKKRGRPRKSPNDTTTAPYVKKEYEYTGKPGRPKKVTHDTWGGARPNTGGAREGAGRKHTSKITGPATISFTVPYAVKERFSRLQKSGFDIRERIVNEINKMAQVRLGTDNVADTWTPPKK